MIIVVMGVAGSGKTTVGSKLAEALDCAFLDGDSLHPRTSIAKMSRGIPLTDADRAPWLAAIQSRVSDAFTAGRDLVIACSALKQSYRAVLARGVPIRWVYLKGPPDLIRSRMQQRPSHFMKPDMLASQFEVLEEPADAIVVDIAQAPSGIVDEILAEIRRTTPAASPRPQTDQR